MSFKKEKNNPKKQIQKAAKNTFERNLKITIFIFGLFLYGGTINHQYVLDDVAIIEANEVTKMGFDGIITHLTHGYWYGFNMSNDHVYRPLAPITFCIEYEFFGENPTVGHLINILLYAFTGVVLFITLRLLFSEINYVLPLIATLLFLAHPIHTEVVSNIKSRDEIFGFLGGISSIYFILKYLDLKSVKYIGLSMLCFLLGILGKESAVTFAGVIPIVLLMIRKTELKKCLILSIPIVLTVVLYLSIRGSVLETITGKSIDVKTNTIATAETFLDKEASAVEALGRYFLLFIYPHPLSHDYSYNQIPVTNWANPFAILSGLFLVGITMYVVFYFFKKNLLKDPYHSQIALGIAFFLITVSIVSNIFLLIGANLAERFMYIPSFGFCLVLAAAIARYTKVNLNDDKFRIFNNTTLLVVLVIILSAYSYKTYSRSMLWKTNESLFEDDVLNAPNSSRVNNSLASVLVVNAKEIQDEDERKAMLERSIHYAMRAIEIFPKYRDAHYNLGTAYGLLNQNTEAINILLKSVAMDSTYSNAHYNLGVIYIRIKEFNKSIQHLKLAAKYDVNNLQIYYNLAEAYKNTGLMEGSINAYKQCLRINPSDELALTNTARLNVESGNIDEGIKFLKKLVQYNPRNVDGWFNLGVIYQQKGDIQNSQKCLNKAFELNPKLKNQQR